MTSRSHHLSRRRLCQTTLVAGGLLVGSTAPATATDGQSTRWLSWSPEGYIADDVGFNGDTADTVEQTMREQLSDVDPKTVIVQPEQGATVEVLDADISEQTFRSAIEASGYSYGSITAGATQQTFDEIIDILIARIDEADFEASVYEAETDSEQYIVVGVSAVDESTARELLSSRGAVSIEIYHDVDGEYSYETGLTREDFSSVGSASQGDRSGPHVPVTVESAAAEAFQQQLVDTGVAQPSGSRCTYEQDPDTTDPCLLVVEDEGVRTAFGMNPSLAETMRDGSWAEDPSFILTTKSFEEAKQVSLYLRTGALPIELSITASDEPPVAESELNERETAVADGGGGATDVSAPGFGAGAAAVALGLVGYLARRESR